MADWPKSSAAVNAKWLDGVLRRNGGLSNVKITSVVADKLGGGVGIMA